jgi:hypothetical protein
MTGSGTILIPVVSPRFLEVSKCIRWEAALAHIIREDFCCDREYTTAIDEQLKALPGIGKAYSEKSIKGRPNQRKDELVQKKILPRATYEGIEYKIVAKQR